MLVPLHGAEHRDLVHTLRGNAERWLAEKGLDQYQRGPRSAVAHQDIDRLFDQGEFVGLVQDDRIAAVVAITDPDPDFWTPAEMAEPQGYISRFLVAEHGTGAGAALLDAVAAREAARGAQWLRLDCWRSNTGLHAYYLRHGFEHVRTMEVAGRNSGALFQRAIATTS